jgi:hypothetical protein
MKDIFVKIIFKMVWKFKAYEFILKVQDLKLILSEILAPE